jgi:hypothetical protein
MFRTCLFGFQLVEFDVVCHNRFGPSLAKYSSVCFVRFYLNQLMMALHAVTVMCSVELLSF